MSYHLRCRFLMRNFSQPLGAGKLRSYWGDQLHTVVSNVGDNPVVYKVWPEHEAKGKVKTQKHAVIFR